MGILLLSGLVDRNAPSLRSGFGRLGDYYRLVFADWAREFYIVGQMDEFRIVPYVCAPDAD